MMLLACNSGLMFAGTWYVSARLWAGIGNCCYCCLNLACIITIACIRFNSWGKLSALCDGPSKYNNDELVLSNEHTVASDASLILGLWVCQMIWFCTYCFHNA